MTTTTKKINDVPSQLEMVLVVLIDEPIQSRPLDEEHVERLRASISGRGLDVPITVHLTPHSSRYILVDGRHRLKAHRLMGAMEIQAIVRPATDDNSIRVAQLTANLHRREMLAIEEAEAVGLLLQICADVSYCATHEGAAEDPVGHVAGLLGQTLTWVRQRMYASRLSPQVRELARVAELPAGHLRELARIGDIVQQWRTANECCRLSGGAHTTSIAECEEQCYDDIEHLRATLASRTPRRMSVEDLRAKVDALHRPLRGVPWRLDLPVLLTPAKKGAKATTLPACIGCPNNSGSDRTLFAIDEAATHDVCADGSCYGRKREAADQQQAKLDVSMGKRSKAPTAGDVREAAPEWLGKSTCATIARRAAKAIGDRERRNDRDGDVYVSSHTRGGPKATVVEYPSVEEEQMEWFEARFIELLEERDERALRVAINLVMRSAVSLGGVENLVLDGAVLDGPPERYLAALLYVPKPLISQHGVPMAFSRVCHLVDAIRYGAARFQDEERLEIATLLEMELPTEAPEEQDTP